jgi:chromosome segregation ATPase
LTSLQANIIFVLIEILLSIVRLRHGQYKFQHSELTSKREKLTHLEAKRSVESTSRSASATSSREALRKRRESSSSLNAPNLSLEEKKRQLEILLESESEEWLASLAEWIGRRTECLWEEGEDVRRDCLLLERKIRGYEAALGEVEMGGEQ